MFSVLFKSSRSKLIMTGGKKSRGGIRGECGGARWPSIMSAKYRISIINGFSYERKAAVAADSNLGLVGVDEDPRVTLGTTATIASNNSLMSPCNRLLVNHLNSRLRLRLSHS